MITQNIYLYIYDKPGPFTFKHTLFDNAGLETFSSSAVVWRRSILHVIQADDIPRAKGIVKLKKVLDGDRYHTNVGIHYDHVTIDINSKSNTKPKKKGERFTLESSPCNVCVHVRLRAPKVLHPPKIMLDLISARNIVWNLWKKCSWCHTGWCVHDVNRQTRGYKNC